MMEIKENLRMNILCVDAPFRTSGSKAIRWPFGRSTSAEVLEFQTLQMDDG